MTHEPPCELSKPCSEITPEHGICGFSSRFCIHCQGWCICDDLKAMQAWFYKAGVAAGIAKAVDCLVQKMEDQLAGHDLADITKMAEIALQAEEPER